MTGQKKQTINEVFSIGHRPNQVNADAEKVLRAIQSNFLSMLSHELRTPLTGIINALSLLEEGGVHSKGTQAMSSRELLSIAKKNATSLHASLIMLLDLAALESGNLQVRKREVTLPLLVNLMSEAHSKNISLSLSKDQAQVLADPQKIKRAVLFLLHATSVLAHPRTKTKLRVSQNKIVIDFELGKDQERAWEDFHLALTASHAGGVFSPASAFSTSFGQLVQEEEEYLENNKGTVEGELYFVQEIARLHGGKVVVSSLPSRRRRVELILPLRPPVEELTEAFRSRIQLNESGEVTVFVLSFKSKAKKKNENKRIEKLRACIFRSSDSVYSLGKNRFALLLNDWMPEADRALEKRIKARFKESFKWSAKHAPQDGLDAQVLVRAAISGL